MKTDVFHSAFLAVILLSAITPLGCSSFSSSGSSDYVGPGGLSQDVSALPDPNAPPSKTKNDSTVLYNVGNRGDDRNLGGYATGTLFE